MAEARVGQPEADRALRKVILESAIAEVAAHGLAALTMQSVSAASGVDAAVIEAQFPTIEALADAAGEAALEQMFAQVLTAMAQTGNPLDGMRAYPDILWEVMSQPAALAQYEIQLAARWDRERLDRQRAAIRNGEAFVEGAVRAMAKRYRMGDVDGYLLELTALNDALQNLALRRDLTGNPARLEAVRQRMRGWHDAALRRRLPEEFGTQI